MQNNKTRSDDDDDDHSTKRLQSWKDMVLKKVGQTIPFTLTCSGIFYALDHYRHQHKLSQNMSSSVVLPKLPFHQSRVFKTLNFAANITTMSFLYFGVHQWLVLNNVNVIRTLKSTSTTPPPPPPQEQQNTEELTPLVVDTLNNSSNRLLQHALSGFITGTTMHALIAGASPKRILTHSTRLGLLVAALSSLSYKSYEQFVLFKHRRVLSLEQQAIEGSETEQDNTKRSFSEVVFDLLPEWLRLEDEDTADVRARYEQIKAIREEMKRIALEEQLRATQQNQQQQDQSDDK